MADSHVHGHMGKEAPGKLSSSLNAMVTDLNPSQIPPWLGRPSPAHVPVGQSVPAGAGRQVGGALSPVS